MPVCSMIVSRSGWWMDDPRRVAWIGDQRRQPITDAQFPLGRSQQQHPAIKGSGHLLAIDCWKAERLGRIVVHGGCGAV